MTDLTSMGFLGVAYAFLVPLMFAQFMALVLIPSLMADGRKPARTAKAIYCYLLESIGIALMIATSFPSLWSVLSGIAFNGRMYLLLLIVFAVGGLTFLWHESIVETLDEPSRAVPLAIFHYTFKLLGYVLTIVGGLLLLTDMLLLNGAAFEGWWIGPFLLLVYGILIAWCTRWPAGHTIVFQASPMKKPPTAPVHPHKRKKG